MQWRGVEETVIYDDQGKADFRAHSAELVMRGGMLRKKDDEDFAGVTIEGEEVSYPTIGFSDRGFSQLCARLEMPGKYVRGIPNHLSDQLFNHHLVDAAANDAVYLLRNRRDQARAVLSSVYSIINNRRIIEMANAIAVGNSKHSSGFAHTIKDFSLTDAGVWLKMVLPELSRPDPIHRGSNVQVGVILGNSEVGERMATCEPFIFRQACMNDLIMVSGEALQQRHVHLKERELEARMAEAMGYAFQAGEEFMRKFIASREIPVADPSAVLQRLVADLRLTKGQAESVDDAYKIEPESNVFGVISALTYAAQKMDPEDRVLVERGAGRYLATSIRKVA